MMDTHGNVVKGNKNFANEILAGAYLVMSNSLLTECQQICNHAIYKFLREKIGNLAMWFPIVFIPIQDW